MEVARPCPCFLGTGRTVWRALRARVSRVGSLISTCFPRGVSRGAPHARPGPLTEAYVGRRRGRAPADAARNARIQRRRVAPVPPAGGAGDSSDDDLEDVVESERPVQFAIKCGWRSLVGLKGEKRTRFLDLVDRTVDYVSWMRVRASHIATLYYLDVCERVELDQSDERHLPLDDLPPFRHVGSGGRWWRQVLYDVDENLRPLHKFSTQNGDREREEKLRRATEELQFIKQDHFNPEKYPPSPRSRSTCRMFLTQRQSGSPPSFACICE